jgi:hypothetical protein
MVLLDTQLSGRILSFRDWWAPIWHNHLIGIESCPWDPTFVWEKNCLLTSCPWLHVKRVIWVGFRRYDPISMHRYRFMIRSRQFQLWFDPNVVLRWLWFIPPLSCVWLCHVFLHWGVPRPPCSLSWVTLDPVGTPLFDLLNWDVWKVVLIAWLE